MKYFLLKSAILSVVLFIIISVIYQVYFGCVHSYETFTVSKSKTEKKIKALGMIYKNELVIDLNANGELIKNIYPDGEKIGVDFEIARIYKTNEDALNFENITTIKDQIKDLEDIQNKSLLLNVNIAELNNNIFTNYGDLLNEIKKNNLNNIKSKKRKLISLFNTKNIIVNKYVNFENSIKKLKMEKEKLENNMNSPYSITSPKSGYFVSGIDGLEKECSLNLIDKMDIDEFYNFLKKNKNPTISNKNSVKIIVDPKIKFKAIVPTNIFMDITCGTNCKIRFKSTGEEIQAKLDENLLNFDREESLAVFSLDAMSAKLARLRKSEADILLDEYECFKIPKQAVKLNKNGEIGVYVIEGISLKFKNIDILDEDKNFIIAYVRYENELDNKNYLKNFDRVVLKGRDLYENKPV